MATRKLSLLQAVSLNMGLMVGVGPFITIPPFLAAMGGPQAMVGWVLGLAKITRRPPLIPAGQLQFLLEDVHPSNAHARAALGWNPTPFAEAIARTVAAFRHRGWIPS